MFANFLPRLNVVTLLQVLLSLPCMAWTPPTPSCLATHMRLARTTLRTSSASCSSSRASNNLA